MDERDGVGEAGVTWDTYVELGRPSGVTVFPNAEALRDGLYVCVPYTFGDRFMMAGNVVGTCSKCTGTIQMRPHAPRSVPKICTACACATGYLDRLPRRLGPGGDRISPRGRSTN